MVSDKSCSERREDERSVNRNLGWGKKCGITVDELKTVNPGEMEPTGMGSPLISG